ncbi:MAG TPA: hypothetical protein VMH36_22550 [Alphaproteobacteria bacterium]|nr:hypothetical protein [Alphaproteobacteria bacterium]
MHKAGATLVCLAGAVALSACGGGITTVRSKGAATYSAGTYVQSIAQNGTNAVVVRNSPVPAQAVVDALRARYTGGQYRFALGTPPDWNGYTVVIGFGAPPVGNQNLCQNPNQVQSATAGSALVADYCYGNRLVTEVVSRGPAVSGPDDPNFRELIGQSIAELFTNDTSQFPDIP